MTWVQWGRRALFCLLLSFSSASPTLAATAVGETKCVRIYYDRIPGTNPKYLFGRVHALYLQNLLGHFPRIQQYILPIESYERGDLEKCTASFYLGTHYYSKIPDSFLTDFVRTKKNVAWLGYNVWRMPAHALKSLWNIKVGDPGLTTIDLNKKDAKGRPHFFKNYSYKGQIFEKYGEWDAEVPGRFNAAHEIVRVDLLDLAAEENVLAWAHHTQDALELPYVIRNKNHWFMAESPFAFITEEDRYLILADLLFDILDEKPRYEMGKKPAVFRLEDVHPRVAIWQLYKMTAMLKKLDIPFSMTIIPIFSDPFQTTTDKPGLTHVPIFKNPHFREWIEYTQKNTKVSFMFHGVTHQSQIFDDEKKKWVAYRNPFSGMSGDDFEFWDRNKGKNCPMPWDSPQEVVRRLEDGFEILKAANVQPVAWLPPHYQASPLDYTIFGQLFRWNVGRVIYFPFAKTRQKERLPDGLTFDVGRLEARGKRGAYLDDLTVDYPKSVLPTGQFFPFEIYGDAWGQRIVPENVGNVQPYMNEQVHKTQIIPDLIRILERNRSLRDQWGSFFIHPFRIEDSVRDGIGKFPGDTSEIERLVTRAKAAGYEFVDLKQWIADRSLEKRPEPIEVFLD